ncbi:response regulator [soil metagenome]
MGSNPHIAIVDDEVEITRLLGSYLQGQGYRITPLHDGQSLMQLMLDDAPALVLLDLGLPGEDGLSIARRLREHHHCGLVIVTGRGDAIDKVVGLEVGADDYVTKPFDLRELAARIKAVIRRMVPQTTIGHLPILPPTGADCLQFGEWTLDEPARSVRRESGVEVALTGGEFDLLCAFVRHPGRVLTREFLLEHTRGRAAGPYDRTIDVQVGRLRRKLGDDVDMPRVIKSVRNAGYVFVLDVRPLPR